MAGELTIPIPPCRLDDMLPFYEGLGLEVTCRQSRPSPYAVVRREDIRLHFCPPDGFEPERSYASVIVVVPDPAGSVENAPRPSNESSDGIGIAARCVRPLVPDTPAPEWRSE